MTAIPKINFIILLQECGRQSLDELMMRPVQRLPSVTLLLNDLLKHTRREKEHQDVVALEKALAKIKEVKGWTILYQNYFY